MYTLPSGEPYGLIYNIQKYTIHDGPGIRTEIFMKGCPMNCIWCSNPESQNPLPEIGVYKSKCISKEKCGSCIDACPRKNSSPLVFENGFIHSVNTDDECRKCLICVDECPGRAIMLWGKKMTIPELMNIIEEDRSFYERSGGGVTLNGGEVMMQWEFAMNLLKACKEAGINTCVESALICKEEHMDSVLEFTDILITDIKDMDTERHLKYTGVGNEIILENIKHAAEIGTKIVLRTPIVPKHNDDIDGLRKIAKFINENLRDNIIQYQLLPYRKMGTEKYETLNRPYPMGDFVPPEREVWESNLLEITEILKSEYDIPIVAGSNQKLLL